MSHDKKDSGTTLLELMLAMAFVSALLVAIALTTIRISDMYNRGITLKEVDQAGQSMTNELQRMISQVSAFDVSSKFIEQTDATGTYAGRLCTGKYSYVWNYGKTITAGAGTYPDMNKYDSGSSVIRFVKVPDSTGTYCVLDATNKYPDIKKLLDKPVEMLNVGDRELALHLFTISSPPANIDPITGQQLYKMDFIIGTNDEGTISAGYPGCKEPDATTTNRDLTYCSINSFTLLIRSGNKS